MSEFKNQTTGPVILVADNDPASAELIASHVKHHMEGVEVVTANSCQEARDLALEHPVAAFVIDLHLADGRGNELLRELLKQAPSALGIMTGRMLSFDPEGLPALAYLLKPFSIGDLIGLLRSALSVMGRS